jgi:hypothetical protein
MTFQVCTQPEVHAYRLLNWTSEWLEKLTLEFYGATRSMIDARGSISDST